MLRAVLFYITLATIQLAGYCLSLGLIVHKASGPEGIQGVANVVGVQAVAALLALCLSIIGRRSHILQHGFSIVLLVAWTISSLLLYNLEAFSGAWFLSLLLRIAAAFWMSSFLMTVLASVIKGDTLLANKRAQQSSLLGTLVGTSLGPVLVNWYGIEFIACLDMALAIFIVIGIVLCGALQKGAGTTKLQEANLTLASPFYEGFLRPVYYVSIVMCLLTGIFSIVEVPILKERFSASAEIISSVYVGTILLNLLGMKLTPIIVSPHWLRKIHLLSAMILIICTNFYLFAYSWFVVIFSLIAFGLANGVFNIMQSSLVQLLPLQSQRLVTFLWFRFIGQFTLLFSVGLSFVVNEQAIPYVVLWSSLILTIPFFMILLRTRQE